MAQDHTPHGYPTLRAACRKLPTGSSAPKFEGYLLQGDRPAGTSLATSWWIQLATRYLDGVEGKTGACDPCRVYHERFQVLERWLSDSASRAQPRCYPAEGLGCEVASGIPFTRLCGSHLPFWSILGSLSIKHGCSSYPCIFFCDVNCSLEHYKARLIQLLNYRIKTIGPFIFTVFCLPSSFNAFHGNTPSPETAR